MAPQSAARQEVENLFQQDQWGNEFDPKEDFLLEVDSDSESRFRRVMSSELLVNSPMLRIHI